MNDVDKWVELQNNELPLDADGKIIDFLNPQQRRENKPEERIRQMMGQILHFEYGYPKECMLFEAPINIGRDNTKRADIAIYSNKNEKIQKNQGEILLIAEIKAPEVTTEDGQLASYLSASSAQGGFWTNGDQIHIYRKEQKDGLIIDWIGIPKFGRTWDSVGKYTKEDLIKPVDLKLAFKRCHNAIYKAGIDSEDVALDMVRIILAKIEDESSSDNDCEFYITPEEYDNPKARTVACNRVRKLFSAVRDRYKDVFSENEKITASDSQLAIVMSQLQQYSFLDAPHDVIGTAYEIYVASHLKGERGQYFTNRLVVNMMVKMVEPSDKDIILDPACGSGGFLLASMNYIFDNIDKSNRPQNAKEIIKRNVVHQLFGVDVSPKLVKIAKANMLLGKDGHGGIEGGNSLDLITKLSPKFQEICGEGKPTIILTNPPFGSNSDLKIKDAAIIENYTCGYQWDTNDNADIEFSARLNDKQGIAPELLFLEKCLQWVKPNGIIGIVMAKGQLDNKEAFAIRKLVTKKAQILAVVNLHEDTFEPFCGSKASVLFLKKLEKPLKGDYKIFMAISNKIGQNSRGNTQLKTDNTGNPIIVDGHPILDEDLSDIALEYQKFKNGKLVESEYRFSIAFTDLDKETCSFNPVHYLPQHNASLEKVLTLGESGEYNLVRLGDIATAVYNGPRFTRPYAELGVTEGPTIKKYFTGTALTQTNFENIKYLDTAKASKQQLKALDALVIKKGYLLISDSGTLGRITYALEHHDGHVATNNLIRVIIDEPYLRGYVYQFLKSELGQSLILKNAYGTNQEHLEPNVIADLIIPIPKDEDKLRRIGQNIIESIDALELSLEKERRSKELLDKLFL